MGNHEMTLTHEQALAEAIKVVNQTFVGLFTTIGPDGAPCSRWMGTATLADGLHKLYTLTDAHSRKVQHLAQNPHITWAFTANDCADVVTLTGTARVLTSPLVMQQVFDRLQDYARQWAMAPLGEKENVAFVTIETTVQHVEYLSPRLKIFTPVVLTIN